MGGALVVQIRPIIKLSLALVQKQLFTRNHHGFIGSTSVKRHNCNIMLSVIELKSKKKLQITITNLQHKFQQHDHVTPYVTKQCLV